MRLLVGNEMTPAKLLSTTLVDAEAAWSSATTYATGAIVRYQQSVYESIQNSNTNRNPASSPLWWIRIGSTNSYALFDGQISSVSSAVGSFEVEVETGVIDTFAIVGVNAESATLTIRDGEAGPVVYQQTVGLGAEVFDWFQYFFYDPFIRRTLAVFTDIPPFLNSVATLTVSGGTLNTVSVGVAVFGKLRELGKTKYGASAGIRDFSRKEVDENFGNPTFVRRGYSKTLDADILLSNEEVNRVARTLYDARATPSLWIGSTRLDLEEVMVVYGFFKDFRIVVEYFDTSLCSLEIEGLI